MAERPSPAESSSAADSGSKPPGLGAQFGRTRSALFGLISAHIKLARAEFSEIGGEVKKAAALGGIALLLLLIASQIIVIGLALFLGEAIFGSMGWGILLASEAMLGLAAILVMAVIELSLSRVVEAVLAALFVSVVVAGILLGNWAWFATTYVGAPSLAVELIVAAIVGGAIGAVVGSLEGSVAGSGGFVAFAILGVLLRLVLGTFAGTPTMVAVLAAVVILGLIGALLAPGRSRIPASIGLLIGALIGIAIGLIAGGRPSRHVVGAIALAIWLLATPIAAAYFTFRHGLDVEKLKKRFVPQQTIETTKETIEWVREQLPLGRKS